MNDFGQRLKKILTDYREWLVVATLLGVIAYMILQYRGLDEKQIEKGILGQDVAAVDKSEKLNYEEIVDGVMDVPDPYHDLVKLNPFESIKVKVYKINEIQGLFSEGMRYYTANSYLDAKAKFQQVIELDPYEFLIVYRPSKPTKMIELCELEASRQSIRETYNRAIEKFDQIRLLDQPGGSSDEDLLTLYTEDQQLFNRVIENGQELLPEAWKVAQERVAEVNKRINELEIKLFSATIARLYNEAVDMWNRKDEKPSNLADARDDLLSCQDLIAKYDRELSPDDQQIQNQSTQLLQDIESEVNQVYPILQQQAEQLQATGQGDLEKLTQAQDLYKILHRFRQEEEIKSRIDQMETQLASLRKEAMIAQAKEWLEEARQLHESAKNNFSEGNWDQMLANKNDGLAVLKRFDDLPNIPELETVRADRQTLTAEMQKLKLQPKMQGFVLQGVTGSQRARIFDQNENRRYFLRLGSKDPISGITFVKIGKQTAW